MRRRRALQFVIGFAAGGAVAAMLSAGLILYRGGSFPVEILLYAAPLVAGAVLGAAVARRGGVVAVFGAVVGCLPGLLAGGPLAQRIDPGALKGAVEATGFVWIGILFLQGPLLLVGLLVGLFAARSWRIRRDH